MATYLRMILVLSVITLLSGIALGGLNELTREKAENNILRFKKIPAVAGIYQAIHGQLPAEELSAVKNRLLEQKIILSLENQSPRQLYIINKDGAPYAVAFETFGQGFGGELGVMAGYRLAGEKLVGIGITTLAETPGVGTRVTEPTFTRQFQGMKLDSTFKVKKDGGAIDAVTGATISSRAVAEALRESTEFFRAHQSAIRSAIQNQNRK